MDMHSDVWHVRLQNGETRALTLDQLDTAFQAGQVNEDTLVCKEGTAGWARLGQIAGIDEDLAPPPMSAPPPPVVLAIPNMDVDEPAFRPSRKRGVMMGLAVAALLLVGGGVAFTKFGGPAAMATANGPEVLSNLTAAIPAPLPVAPPKVETPEVQRPVLTDQQKQALLEADKNRASAAAQRKAKSAPPPVHRSKSKSGNPFVKGGSKYDPLNSSL